MLGSVPALALDRGWFETGLGWFKAWIGAGLGLGWRWFEGWASAGVEAGPRWFQCCGLGARCAP